MNLVDRIKKVLATTVLWTDMDGQMTLEHFHVSADEMTKLANAVALDLGDETEITKIEVRYDPAYPHFGLDGEPFEHDQHPNQQLGLDLYIHVINFDTGERCCKKLYKNTLGLYFKHSGYSPMYLTDFTAVGHVIPFQLQSIEER